MNAKRTIGMALTSLPTRKRDLVLCNSIPLIDYRALTTLGTTGADNVSVLALAISGPFNLNHVGHSAGNGVRTVIRRGSTDTSRRGVRRVGDNVCYISGTLLRGCLPGLSGSGTRRRCCLASVIGVTITSNVAVTTVRPRRAFRVRNIGGHRRLTDLRHA